MNNERYRVVRQLECDTYYMGSPVQIEKGNILLDSQASTLILQLKLCNVSDKTINAVYLSADYYDNTNHLLHSGMELNYLGLNCAPKQACGSDTPMKLPDDNIYNIKLHIAKVMFIDGSMIDVAPQTIQIPKQQQIAEVFGDEAAGAAKRVLNNSVCYIPQELNSGVWLCGCGQANEKEVCISCGITKNKVFEAVNGEYLQQVLEQEKQQRIEMERQKAQQRAETEEKLKKIGKKFAVVGTPILVVIIVVTLIFTQFIIPQQQLRGVNTLVDNGEYNKALVELAKMKRYDTPERIDEIRQKKAVSLLDSGNYDTARIVIENLHDITPMIPKIQEIADTLLEKGDYGNAISMYKIAGNTEAVHSTLKNIREKNATYSNKIASGSSYAVRIKKDGTVTASGWNTHGQCNVSDWTDIMAISANIHTVGLKSDGTVVATGYNDNGQCDVSDWTDIVAISASQSHTVGLKTNGTVVATGYNKDGQCNVSDWTDIKAIAAGVRYTVGLKSDGTVIATGYNNSGQCNVSDWTDIVAISAGAGYTVGLKSDGTVVAVGLNDDGQCNVSDWTDIVSVSADSEHTVGLKSDGTVVATGNNDDGKCNVSDWTDIVAISTDWTYTVGLKADGTVVAVGDDNYDRCDVASWNDIVAIVAGPNYTIGLKDDDTVVTAGEYGNAYDLVNESGLQ